MTTTAATPPNSFFDRLAIVARDIKLSHSIFAMPFALLAMFLAAGSAGRLPSVWTFVLIVVCMVFARTVAMTFNRWADRRLDVDNPRTAGRAIPSGKLAGSFVAAVGLACAAGFVATASAFWWLAPEGAANPWPLLASPLVLVWLCLYSLTKRFTWLCHLFLGSALALSPIAAALAVQPDFLAVPEPYLLALMVMCWVAGFDVIYALQDVTSDRDTGVHSMPANLGEQSALWIARGLHVLSLAALVILQIRSPQLNLGFAAASVIVAALLILEHTLVWRSKTNHIHMAFFTLNGIISVVLGVAGIVDIALR